MTEVWIIEERDWGGVGSILGVYRSEAAAKREHPGEWVEQSDGSWEIASTGPIVVLDRHEVAS